MKKKITKNKIPFVYNEKLGIETRQLKIGGYIITEGKENFMAEEVIIEITNGKKTFSLHKLVWPSRGGRTLLALYDEGSVSGMITNIKKPTKNNHGKIIGVSFPDHIGVSYFSFKELNTSSGISIEKMEKLDGEFVFKNEVVLCHRIDGQLVEVVNLLISAPKQGPPKNEEERTYNVSYLTGWRFGKRIIKQVLIKIK
jgi:hypothetical protein